PRAVRAQRTAAPAHDRDARGRRRGRQHRTWTRSTPIHPDPPHRTAARIGAGVRPRRGSQMPDPAAPRRPRAPVPRSARHRARRLPRTGAGVIGRLWPLVAATVALGIDAYVLAGILPQIAGSLTTTAAMIGLGVTAFTAAYAVSGPGLASRLGARGAGIALLVALGVFNLGNLITALAPGIGVFLTARVVAGTGAGILTAVATGTAAALAPPAQRGRAMMAMVTFGLSLGTVAGVPLGMLIGRTAGWRWTMGAVVVIGAVAMVAVAVRARTLPSLAGPARPTFPLMRLPRVRAGVGAAFGLGTASLGL